MKPAGEGVALATLLGRLPAAITGDASARVTRIDIDSREVRPGSLFVALRGEHVDGHEYVARALENGASVIVVERGRRQQASSGAVVVEVESTRRALSAIAAAFYGDPSQALRVIGVTGTNGKTTTTHMIAAISNESGMPCGIIGTVGGSLRDRSWSLAHTTPFPHELHGILAEMRDAGARSVAMEVSSHALALERVEDVSFACGVLTNVTRDHLDFHGTPEAYAAAKRRLFTMAKSAVLNTDDAHGALWAQELRGLVPLATFALEAPAEIVACDVRVSAKGSTFAIDATPFSLGLPGRFNVSNALAAVGAARRLGIDDATSARALAAMAPVRGRMERIAGAGVDLIVDYAHTPDALEQALSALREITAGKLAVVFGCGGDRDRGKRPEMGAIAARLADRIYVTNDNPRHEEPLAIARAIVAGIGAAPHVLELDRRAAIERAVREAAPGDTVLVAGKGHETYQIVGDESLPFDDASVARDALAKRSR